jgi:putative inorganic carbon (HCO3(-)) transporter
LRNPLALAPADRAATALLAVALILAPLAAGTFATPPAEMAMNAPQGPLAWLQTLGFAPLAALIAAALLVTVWREWKRPVAIGAVPFLAGASLLLLCWAGVSLLRTPALYLGLNALLLLLSSLTGAALAARLCRDWRGFAVLFTAIVVAGTLVGVIGVMEYLTAWNPSGKLHDPLHRTTATFLNPDFLAGYLLLTVPLSLAAFATVRENLQRLGLGLGLMVQSGCLLLTASRTGLAALLVGAATWAALCIWCGAARGRKRRIGLALALVAVGAILASAPTRSRLTGPGEGAPAAAPPASTGGNPQGANALPPIPAEASRSQSLLFRRYTWEGTLRMARANPILGTGLGSFEVAYPRYAVTAYTAHAHNSLLQWTAETGMPGALLLMTVFAAAAAFVVNVLRLRRQAILAVPDEGENTPIALAVNLDVGVFDEPGALLAGLLAALVASAIKTFLDSDWYIAATALTLCMLIALMVGLARDIAPLATQTPRPLSKSMLAASALVALLILWRATQTGVARLDTAQAAAALNGHQAQEALDSLRSAVESDPFDPETHLELALIYQAMDRPADQRKELLAAVRVAPTGKDYYRLAQYESSAPTPQEDGSARDPAAALDAYRQALKLEPHNLQTLHRLADMLAKMGRTDEAADTYRIMTGLETTPYGTVRAIGDEMIETEFAYAHVGLAKIAAARGQWAEATREYAGAGNILRLYWMRRHWLAYVAMSEPKRAALAQLYHEVLTEWLEALQKENAPQAEIEPVKNLQKWAEDGMEADRAAAAAAGGGASQ